MAEWLDHVSRTVMIWGLWVLTPAGSNMLRDCYVKRLLCKQMLRVRDAGKFYNNKEIEKVSNIICL